MKEMTDERIEDCLELAKRLETGKDGEHVPLAEHLEKQRRELEIEKCRRFVETETETKPKEKPIEHGDDKRCTCGPCPDGVDDMFWRQDEELMCERRHLEKRKKSATSK